MKRTVFFISDRTGITAVSLGQALLSQFDDIEFDQRTVPYVDTLEKAEKLVEAINEAAEKDGALPLIFDTVVTQDIRRIIRKSNSMVMDVFHTFIGPMEKELGAKSSFTVGKQHSINKAGYFDKRIAAVNYALNNDDGITTRYYDNADIILVGVSRCGKTPTSLYMAMQFGIRAANYPFIEEDMGQLKLTQDLKKYKHKVFGLTIDPVRLHEIRTERKANSKYASLQQCQRELREVEALYRKEKIPFINTTSKSIEEIATKVIIECDIERKFY
jgi:[pyruvate, water dikinase]-phosphate phosphotransferase / [pyruvate, water dikinase] kinase